jgi:hypothetical protein
MGQMQPRSNSVSETRSAIRSIENKTSGGKKVPDNATPSVEDKGSAKRNDSK